VPEPGEDRLNFVDLDLEALCLHLTGHSVDVKAWKVEQTV
jgi:hypothetical protein